MSFLSSNDSIPLPSSPNTLTLDEVLRARAFARAGQIHYFNHGARLTFRTAGSWHVLTEFAGEPAEPADLGAAIPAPPTELGSPALWKWVRANGTFERRFEIPTWSTVEEAGGESSDTHGPSSIGALLDWALATRTGSVPADWTSPPVELVESWLPRGALTVQTRGHVRQGELHLTARRWALRLPVLPALAPGLPALRAAALAELLAEAQARWAMVRIDRTPATTDRPASIVAEVDFTGAPPCELLFLAGLDALRHVVVWLVETADVLGDPAVTITGLGPARGGANQNPKERRQP